MTYEVAITTIDNPFDPFEQFTSWNSFDVEKGYNTCSLLATLAEISDEMTEIEEIAERERVIDEIIKNDPLNIYIKLTKPLTISEE